MEYITPGLIIGLCYGIAAIGISFPLRFLGSADFTAVGSLLIGGIVTVIASNLFGYCAPGLFLGAIVAGCLGFITAFLSLNKYIKTHLMFAGIICFTASQSLGLLLTSENASVSLSDNIVFLQPVFNTKDAFLLFFITLGLCIIIAFIARTKYGCLAFAMCANNNFLRYRHRYFKHMTYALLFISNCIVGLSGGLIALKQRTAYSEINIAFLSVALGAIFGGNAVIKLLARLMRKNLPEISTIITSHENKSEGHGFIERFRISISDQRDDSERMFVILFSYALAAVLLNDVAVLVSTHMFFDVPASLEKAIVAIMIIAGISLSNVKSERSKW